MGELLFIATVVFVAYVVFVVLGEKKDVSEPSKSEALKPEVQQPEKIELPPEPVKSAAKAKPAGARSSARAKPAAAAKTAAAAPTAAATAVDSLKNPKTGEVAKIPGSYTFAKRWIKDALVEEGLLEKVYKNNELDEATNAKIQNALQQLKTLEKYQ